MTLFSNLRINILYLDALNLYLSKVLLRHWQIIEIITYCCNLSGYYEVGHSTQQYMHCLRQKRTRPLFNSGWMLLLHNYIDKCTWNKCIIWNNVTKYVMTFLCEKWKQIKYLTTSLSSFSVLSMLFIESYLLPQFMYDSFLFHSNQHLKMYNYKHSKHQSQILRGFNCFLVY